MSWFTMLTSVWLWKWGDESTLKELGSFSAENIPTTLPLNQSQGLLGMWHQPSSTLKFPWFCQVSISFLHLLPIAIFLRMPVCWVPHWHHPFFLVETVETLAVRRRNFFAGPVVPKIYKNLADGWWWLQVLLIFMFFLADHQLSDQSAFLRACSHRAPSFGDPNHRQLCFHRCEKRKPTTNQDPVLCFRQTHLSTSASIMFPKIVYSEVDDRYRYERRRLDWLWAHETAGDVSQKSPVLTQSA